MIKSLTLQEMKPSHLVTYCSHDSNLTKGKEPMLKADIPSSKTVTLLEKTKLITSSDHVGLPNSEVDSIVSLENTKLNFNGVQENSKKSSKEDISLPNPEVDIKELNKKESKSDLIDFSSNIHLSDINLKTINKLGKTEKDSINESIDNNKSHGGQTSISQVKEELPEKNIEINKSKIASQEEKEIPESPSEKNTGVISSHNDQRKEYSEISSLARAENEPLSKKRRILESTEYKENIKETEASNRLKSSLESSITSSHKNISDITKGITEHKEYNLKNDNDISIINKEDLDSSKTPTSSLPITKISKCEEVTAIEKDIVHKSNSDDLHSKKETNQDECHLVTKRTLVEVSCSNHNDSVEINVNVNLHKNNFLVDKTHTSEPLNEQPICKESNKKEETENGKQTPDSQDILARACLAVGLDENELINISEQPFQYSPDETIKTCTLYPNTHWDKADSGNFIYNQNPPNKNYISNDKYLQSINHNGKIGSPGYFNHMRTVERHPNQHIRYQVPHNTLHYSNNSTHYQYPQFYYRHPSNYYKNSAYGDSFYYKNSPYKNLPQQHYLSNNRYSYSVGRQPYHFPYKDTQRSYQIKNDPHYNSYYPQYHSRIINEPPKYEIYKEYGYDNSFKPNGSTYPSHNYNRYITSTSSTTSENTNNDTLANYPSKKHQNLIGHANFHVRNPFPVKTLRPPVVALQNSTSSGYSPSRSPISPAPIGKVPTATQTIINNEINNNFKNLHNNNRLHNLSNVYPQKTVNYDTNKYNSQYSYPHLNNASYKQQAHMQPYMHPYSAGKYQTTVNSQNGSHPSSRYVHHQNISQQRHYSYYSNEASITVPNRGEHMHENTSNNSIYPSNYSKSVMKPQPIPYEWNNQMNNDTVDSNNMTQNSPYNAHKILNAEWKTTTPNPFDKNTKIENNSNFEICKNKYLHNFKGSSPGIVEQRFRESNNYNNNSHLIDQIPEQSIPCEKIYIDGTSKINPVPTIHSKDNYNIEHSDSRNDTQFKSHNFVNSPTQNQTHNYVNTHLSPSTATDLKSYYRESPLVSKNANYTQINHSSSTTSKTITTTANSSAYYIQSSHSDYYKHRHSSEGGLQLHSSIENEPRQFLPCRYQKQTSFPEYNYFNTTSSSTTMCSNSPHPVDDNDSNKYKRNKNYNYEVLNLVNIDRCQNENDSCVKTTAQCSVNQPVECSTSCVNLFENKSYIKDTQQLLPNKSKCISTCPTAITRPSSEPLYDQGCRNNVNYSSRSEKTRPFSLPNEISIGSFIINRGYSTYSKALRLEEKNRTLFEHKLIPVIDHLLSIPEASNLRSLRDNPDELLKHLVQLWGGEGAHSKLEDLYLRMKDNFIKVVKYLFDLEQLIEWGWHEASPEQILDELIRPSDEGWLSAFSGVLSKPKERQDSTGSLSDILEDDDDVFLPTSESMEDGSTQDVLDYFSMLPSSEASNVIQEYNVEGLKVKSDRIPCLSSNNDFEVSNKMVNSQFNMESMEHNNENSFQKDLSQFNLTDKSKIMSLSRVSSGDEDCNTKTIKLPYFKDVELIPITKSNSQDIPVKIDTSAKKIINNNADICVISSIREEDQTYNCNFSLADKNICLDSLDDARNIDSSTKHSLSNTFESKSSTSDIFVTKKNKTNNSENVADKNINKENKINKQNLLRKSCTDETLDKNLSFSHDNKSVIDSELLTNATFITSSSPNYCKSDEPVSYIPDNKIASNEEHNSNFDWDQLTRHLIEYKATTDNIKNKEITDLGKCSVNSKSNIAITNCNLGKLKDNDCIKYTKPITDSCCSSKRNKVYTNDFCNANIKSNIIHKFQNKGLDIDNSHINTYENCNSTNKSNSKNDTFQKSVKQNEKNNNKELIGEKAYNKERNPCSLGEKTLIDSPNDVQINQETTKVNGDEYCPNKINNTKINNSIKNVDNNTINTSTNDNNNSSSNNQVNLTKISSKNNNNHSNNDDIFLSKIKIKKGIVATTRDYNAIFQQYIEKKLLGEKNV